MPRLIIMYIHVHNIIIIYDPTANMCMHENAWQVDATMIVQCNQAAASALAWGPFEFSCACLAATHTCITVAANTVIDSYLATGASAA